jgi:cbb3-type cytochrome oxidase cytochrome c subunit
MQDPKFQRKEMKRKYMNKSYKLQPGDWGFIAQSLLDYTQKHSKVTFTELKEYYDVILRGNNNMIKGGSFIHHLQSLRCYPNAKNRRCGRYLIKDMNDGKYLIGQY